VRIVSLCPSITKSLVALLIGGLRPTPTPTPASAPASFVIVEKDGSLVRLQKAPALKGSTYVGRLWTTGQLVSIPVAKVDDRRTAAANAGGRAGTPTSETNIGTRYKPAGPQAPLGDTMKLKGGRRKVERTLQGTPTPAKTPGAAGTAGSGGMSPPPAGPVDRNGRGEAWWRGRAAPLVEELADAEADLKLSSDERSLFERTPAPPDGEGSLERQRRRNREEQARQRVSAAKQHLDELAAEARKAGAPPGWVR
jgi:hypothetical protein